MKKVLCLLLCLVTIFSVVSCATKSAKDQLNEYELIVYTSIINNISKFKDPSSVTVDSIWQKGDCVVSLTIYGKNSYGGITSSEYLIFTSDFKSTEFSKVEISQYTLTTLNDVLSKVSSSDSFQNFINKGKLDLELGEGDLAPEYSEEKINAALKEYKQSKGWID